MTSQLPSCGPQIDMGQPLYAGGARLVVQLAAPLWVQQAHTATELRQLLADVQQAASDGLWCVGGLCYEAASALTPHLTTHPAQQPLAWFGIYAPPNTNVPPATASATASPAPELLWSDNLHRSAFNTALQAIHDGIAQGRFYQVNYTHQMQGHSRSPVDTSALFVALQQAQPGGYALSLDMGAQHVLSVSPELFFDWHQPAQGNGHILTRPMKGTAARGSTAQQDAQQARHLRSSLKEQAENVMIVDLLRNDLGRIATTGTVQVSELFAVQALPTVWQMTSDVRADLPQGTELRGILQALFPCGSVTGAPKAAAMQAIAALENNPRGWYCGALGVVRPDGAGGVRATFNVPIRTLVLQQDRSLSCGIGSGITADAHMEGEWREWHYKRAFIERVSMPFQLLETLALDNGTLRHLNLHMQRMALAAAHFNYPWHATQVHQALQSLAVQHAQGLWRVRLLLSSDGSLQTQAFACPPSPQKVRLQWASAPLTQTHSEFVRFKTTRRAHYDAWTPQDTNVFDTILWNEDGEITECTRGNIAAFLDERWVTPPLACGLLPGIGRTIALAQGKVTEASIHLQDANRVQQWAFINSLRGWITAEVMATQPVWPPRQECDAP